MELQMELARPRLSSGAERGEIMAAQVTISLLDYIDTAAACLRSAADQLRDLTKPNSGTWETATHYESVAKRLDEAREALKR